MRVGSLFAGIGGFDLGFERAGMHTAWQVELDPYCRAVLAQHFPDAIRYEDVREVGAHNLAQVDLICGGFPCQDLSVAGKGAGIDGERSGLWAEFARIIGELRPRYVVIENVPALLSPPFGRPRGCVCGGADRGRGVADDHQEQQGVLLGSDRDRDDETGTADPAMDSRALWRQGLEVARGYGALGGGVALASDGQGGEPVGGIDAALALCQGGAGGLARGPREGASAVDGGGQAQGADPSPQPEGSRCGACGGTVGHPPGKPAAGVSRVLGDLATLGYDAEWDCLPASAFGAPHRRDRIWLVAYPGVDGAQGHVADAEGDDEPDQPRLDDERRPLVGAGIGAGSRDQRRHSAEGGREPRGDRLASGARAMADPGALGWDRGQGQQGARRQEAKRGEAGGDAGDSGGARGAGQLADAGSGGLESSAECDGEPTQPGQQASRRHDADGCGGAAWWGAEPGVGRVADGVPARVDRLAALGNALVPQIAEWIGRRILAYEEGSLT